MRFQLTPRASRAATAALLGAALLAPQPAAAATFVADTDAGTSMGHFHYYGRWEHVRNLRDGRFFGTSSRTAMVGAVVTLRFVGSVVRLYGVRGPGGGRGVVTLDGKRFPDIDFFAATKQPRAIVFDSPLLRSATHVLAIAAVGEPRKGHHSSYINISGAVYE